ncbi:aldehyde dehydrogenase EutE [Candidatus Sumerlaeota bacterium]|nr:aldehyde dehydrogenase EutE [Candidatus Sumerlaeota bacterium]
MNENQIRGVVEQVLKKMMSGEVKLAPGAAQSVAPPPPPAPKPAQTSFKGRGVFDTVDQAVNASLEAFRVLNSMSLEQRGAVIAGIRKWGVANARDIAERTFQETGMGRIEDKLNKMFSSSERTPGIEDLKIEAWSGDYGLTTEEMGPYGVIAAVTPSTHPVPTLVNNAISMIAAGNTIVFAPHPAAKNVFLHALDGINDAIAKAGGPDNLLTTTVEPSIENAQRLFYHAETKLLVVTGGPGVVNAAMKVPKKVIAAGPGNPPVVIDETADIKQAVADIIEGGGFDNNILCTAEKEIFVVNSVFDLFMREMSLAGMVLLEKNQIETLAKAAFLPGKGGGEPLLNRELVGRNASALAERVGIRISDDIRLLYGETEANHIFVMEEQMMPFIPIVRVPDAKRAIDLAIAAEGQRYHTSMIHSRNIANMHEMARRVNTTIFIKNGSCLAGLGVGGEGTLSFTIATPTGEGVTTARTFTRRRRCALKRYFHIV